MYNSNNRMTTLIQTFGGNIGIGTNDPGSYKLRVEGGMKTSTLEVAGVTHAQCPIGMIAMWYGTEATIPTGWHACDGTTGISKSDGSGTIDAPNMDGHLVKGAGNDTDLGVQLGSPLTTIPSAVMPAHSHSITVDSHNAPHRHYADGSNAPHRHYADGANAPHAHNLYGIQWRQMNGWDNNNVHGGGWAIQASPGQRHGTDGANAPHAHWTRYENANHGHWTRYDNAPHNHDASSADTGGGNAIQMNFAFVRLWYIIKI